jgi:hypothetical protein
LGTIFISYRRGEDAGYAGWLYDILERKLPNHELFLDIHRIDYGSDFRQEIVEWVESCDAFVIVIGRGWAERADLIGAPRLGDGEDLVRIEIETALRREPQIPVIPIVLPGATLPLANQMPGALHPLLRRNALETTHARFRQYCEELTQSIDRQLTKDVSIATAHADVEDSRVDYWSAFALALREKNWPMPLREEPPRTGFYPFTLDSKRGVYLYAYRDAIRRCLGAYIGLAGAGSIAKIVFDTWKSQRGQIEATFGERLAWRELQPPRNYHIQIDLHADPVDRSDWGRQHGWLSDRLLRLYSTFYSKVNELPSKEELTAEANSALSVNAAVPEKAERALNGG